MKTKYKKKIFGFTLVELIIVITILTILATIGFINFQGNIASSRDAKRLSTLLNIEKGLEYYIAKNSNYPIPDNKSIIYLSGTEISYQGIIGKRISNLINFSETPSDPLDGEPYYYITNTKNTKYRILGYLENKISISKYNAYASDNSLRSIFTRGINIPILADENKKIILSDTDLFLSGSYDKYNEIISDNTFLNGSGVDIGGQFQMLSLKDGNFLQPQSCPIGYVPVPGNKYLGQPGFCVAKYEMSYDGVTTPDSIGGGLLRNSARYFLHSGSIAVSKPGNYAIADITQENAIKECEKIGAHLITNSQRMTIARNIELIGDNWSGGKVGSGGIYRGITNLDDSMGCKAKGGNLENYNWSTKTGPGVDPICDQKRQHKLSNGEVIWDFSGNLREHVNKANTINSEGFDKGGKVNSFV